MRLLLQLRLPMLQWGGLLLLFVSMLQISIATEMEMEMQMEVVRDLVVTIPAHPE